MQIGWELESDVWGDPQRRFPEDWLPGHADVYLRGRYRAAVAERLQKLSALLAETSGVKAASLSPVKDRIQAWLGALQKSLAADATAAELREKFYQLATVQDTIALAARPRSLRLAVEDQRQMFHHVPRAEAYLARIAAWKAAWPTSGTACSPATPRPRRAAGR